MESTSQHQPQEVGGFALIWLGQDTRVNKLQRTASCRTTDASKGSFLVAPAISTAWTLLNKLPPPKHPCRPPVPPSGVASTSASLLLRRPLHLLLPPHLHQR
jgi:hypothetical protein